MLNAVSLLCELIKCPSVTPLDEGCQTILTTELEKMGFAIQLLPSSPVQNFWAKRGTQQPLFVFAGHTDVVTPGDKTAWQFDPYEARVHEGNVHGRGAQDMKGPLAAMVVATKRFITEYPEHHGSIGFLITSGEEGSDYMQGTPFVMQYLKKQGEHIKWCVVGEPSSDKKLGDTIRHGRRGSLHGYLTVYGKQGHVAYHHLAKNPIHQVMSALDQLINTQWDAGNADFDSTSLQISSIEAGTFGKNNNVIPAQLKLQFNFRYSPLSTHDTLKARVIEIFNQHNLDYKLDWELSGEPFITHPDTLREAAKQAIKTVMGFEPIFSTSGGTSDARFIAPSGAQVIELGVTNDRIHQTNERVSIEELEQLVEVYYQLLVLLLTKK
jgi:succinyl-diaminopimelate desuccinylase